MFTILPPNEQTWQHLNQSDARYLAGEWVQVRVNRRGFQLEYTPLSTAEWRSWPTPAWLTRETLASHADWVCFFAFQAEKLMGQLVAKPASYRLCELVDLRVDASARRQGVGKELITACLDWAGKRALKGICAEVSDRNPVACQFLESSGFELGGVDKLKRRADPEQESTPAPLRDSALSFYRFFA